MPRYCDSAPLRKEPPRERVMGRPPATDLRQQAQRGAAYVDKILRGTPVGSLPVELMSKYELVINLKTAKVLGLTIPQSLMARADEVIE